MTPRISHPVFTSVVAVIRQGFGLAGAVLRLEKSVQSVLKDTTVSNWDAASGSGIDVQGKVFGWFRLPQPLSFYADGGSGMGEAFPRNAVMAALQAGVDFSSYDMLGENIVTALFVIHAGGGAEQTLSRGDIWSHKWIVPDGVKVGDNLSVRTYLTVPEDCNMKEEQYIVVEYRRRHGQDAFSPDEGIAVYVVDESINARQRRRHARYRVAAGG